MLQMHFDILDEYVTLKQIILVALIHKKKKMFRPKEHTDNNSISHSNKFDSNRWIFDSRRSLRRNKKTMCQGNEGKQKGQTDSLGPSRRWRNGI